MYPITTVYHIKKFPEESPQRFSRRNWFIAKQRPKNASDLKQAIKWSIIDASISYDGVTYSDEISDLVTRMKIK
jgi:hypothetical protein